MRLYLLTASRAKLCGVCSARTEVVDDIGMCGPPGCTSGAGWGLPRAVDGVIGCGGDLGALGCADRVDGGAGLAHGERADGSEALSAYVG